MWYVLAIIAITIGIIFYEGPALLRSNQKKDLYAFSVFLAFAVILSIAEAFNVNIPNPLDMLTNIYKPISDLIFDVLK